MNNDIALLAARARNLAHADVNMMWSQNPSFEALFIEHFAKLVIKECVNVGERAFLNDNTTVPVFPTKQIKDHFGVEE